MSYYNYLYLPTLPSEKIEDIPKYKTRAFTADEEGFQELVNLIGEEFVRKYNNSKPDEIILKEVSGGTDYIRPSDLYWNMNRTRKVYYGDPDCTILVSQMATHINWSEARDIEDTEEALSIYEKAIQEHGEKVLIYPE